MYVPLFTLTGTLKKKKRIQRKEKKKKKSKAEVNEVL